jgi:hypothetical protein
VTDDPDRIRPWFSLLLMELSLRPIPSIDPVGAVVAVDRLGLEYAVDVRGNLLLAPPFDGPRDDVSPLTLRGIPVTPGPSRLRGRYNEASRSWVIPTTVRFGVDATSMKADDCDARWPWWPVGVGGIDMLEWRPGGV